MWIRSEHPAQPAHDRFARDVQLPPGVPEHAVAVRLQVAVALPIPAGVVTRMPSWMVVSSGGSSSSCDSIPARPAARIAAIHAA
jgi:hypothetical protein